MNFENEFLLVKISFESLSQDNIKMLQIESFNKKLVFFRNDFIKYRITEKVFAKGGLNWTKSSISTERSKLLFQIVKLQKNTI